MRTPVYDTPALLIILTTHRPSSNLELHCFASFIHIDTSCQRIFVLYPHHRTRLRSQISLLPTYIPPYLHLSMLSPHGCPPSSTAHCSSSSPAIQSVSFITSFSSTSTCQCVLVCCHNHLHAYVHMILFMFPTLFIITLNPQLDHHNCHQQQLIFTCFALINNS